MTDRRSTGPRARVAICMMLAIWLVPASAQRDAPSGGVTVKATRVAPVPAGAAVRVMGGSGGELDPALIDLAESILRDQGVTVSASGPYTLYLSRLPDQRKPANRPPIGVSLEGGGRRVETAQVQIPIRGRTKGKRPGDGAVRGLEGNLEGPGGITYWRVQVLARDPAGDTGLSEARLLRHGLEAFGLTVVREVSDERG